MLSSSSLPFGVWPHVACTWDASSSSVEIYINGVLQSSSAGGSSSTGNDNVMTIGSRTNGAQYFMGELDELRIWDRIRTSCEISAAMNSEFTVSQANLVAYYNFNQGVAGGSNIGITSLPDFTTNYNGSLINFGLTSNISNWVSSGANITSVNQGNGVFTGIDTRTECNSYTWIDGNTYSANNNSATFNIVGGAANGCDSLVTLDLTINNSTSGTDTRTECNSYTWIDGNTYSTSNNSATFNIVGGAANGCDSLVTLNLTINTVSDLTTSTSGVTITANNSNATYQWLDCTNSNAIITGEISQSFTATANGNYAVELTENGCVDTSVCIAITSVGILENSFGNAIKVYPNPTIGKLSIDLGGLYPSILVIVNNELGQETLKKMYMNRSMIELTIDGEKGIYFVHVYAESKSAILKVIKE